MERDTFEIVLRVKGDSDYSTFEVDADTDLHELECMICDMLDRKFNFNSVAMEVSVCPVK